MRSFPGCPARSVFFTALLALFVFRATGVLAQDSIAIWQPDSTLADLPRSPIAYFTTYDLDVSYSTWTQSLSYTQPGKHFFWSADGAMNVLTPIGGQENQGKDGSFNGRLGFRATKQWLWNLDGLFNMSSNESARSRTQRRQNRAQVRTQYSAAFVPGLSGTALLFTELQGAQDLSRKSVPASSPDSGVSLPDVIVRDSTYTSGRRDGTSATLRWTPSSWLEMTALGSRNWNHLTTNTLQRKYTFPPSGEGLPDEDDSLSTTETPTGDERYETFAFYRGVPKTLVQASLRSKSGNQTMWVYSRAVLDQLSWYDRAANLKIEHTPFAGSNLTVEGTFAQAYREYDVQGNLTTLGRTQSGSVNYFVYRPDSKITAGFQLNRVRNDLQTILPNGLIINRAMNASGARRINDRLWLEGAGTVSLFSRQYDNPAADRDDFRGYANVGGGYRVSSRCSTTVRFSVTRAHTVAIDQSASGENNVQTSYQMDASLKLRLNRTLQILQNYQINANYFLYDFEFQDRRNTLTRIRRIDTVLSDSLFEFAILRVTHNFLNQDQGSYSRSQEDGIRRYGVSSEFYVQNLGVTLAVRPVSGVILNATQSLRNTRNYFYGPSARTNRNEWNLNLGAQVDRQLPGDMSIQGTIQRIDQYTEADEKLPRRDEKSYWLAGASLQKNF